MRHTHSRYAEICVIMTSNMLFLHTRARGFKITNQRALTLLPVLTTNKMLACDMSYDVSCDCSTR